MNHKLALKDSHLNIVKSLFAKIKYITLLKKPAALITEVFKIFNNGINDRRSNKLKRFGDIVFHIFNFID